MQKIVIDKLGPVDHCDLELDEFTVFTGPQASGKSTVAKSIFFFKNIKNIVFAQFKKKYFLKNTLPEEEMALSLKNRMEREIRSNFLQIFGTTWHMDMSMHLSYHYAEDISIDISLRTDPIFPNRIWIDLSTALRKFIWSLEDLVQDGQGSILNGELSLVKERIDRFFGDDAEIVYIPAGRSMITLLSTQLNYIYSSMDDTQKKNLDYCTQSYLERILQLKPEFSISADQMIYNVLRLTDKRIDKQMLFLAAEAMKSILQGEYRYVDGEERLQVAEDRYVKINFSSSGQQEVVWILNVIFYHLLNNRKAYFIIEEPGSHLFPNAQKKIAEFIAYAKNKGKHKVLITTHSPYILGTINNLLYADRISKSVDKKELEKIIPQDKWLPFSDVSAYFIDRGLVTSCMDEAFGAIENEVIDGASVDINRDFDEMVALKEKYFTESEA